MNVYKKIWATLDKKSQVKIKILFFLMIFSMIAETLSIGLILPVIGLIVDPNFLNKFQSNINFILDLKNMEYTGLLVFVLSLLVISFILKNLYLVFFYWCQYSTVYSIQRSISKKLLFNYLNRPYTFHIQKNSAQLIRNTTTEVAQLTLALTSAITFITEFLVVFGIIILLILIDPITAVIAAIIFSVIGMIFQKLTRNQILKWGKNRHAYEGKRIQDLQQGLGGIKEVKLYGRETYFMNSYDKNNLGLTKMIRNQKFMNQLPRVLVEIIAILIFILMIAAVLYTGNEINTIIPTLGLFGASATRLIPSINRIMAAAQNLRFSGPVVDVVYSELDSVRSYQILDKKDGLNDVKLEFLNSIKINNLSYKYPKAESDVLTNINITIKHGDCIGIVGASGEGKSTLVDLLTGLLPPKSGSIELDEVNIYENLRDYQNIIGYVSQNIYLLDSSIKNNIAFGFNKNDINLKLIESVLKKVELFDFINALPDNIETNIGERGVKLSGGQRQRIGIARALYSNPDIIIFDEATSALDNETENKIMHSVNKLKRDKTILIISHRHNALDFCDQIYSIEDKSIKKIK